MFFKCRVSGLSWHLIFYLITISVFLITKNLIPIIMKLSTAIGGLAGACALTLLNEGFRKVDPSAPRLDLLGKNVALKVAKGVGLSSQAGNLYPTSLAGDLLSNALYFGMARSKNATTTLVRGALLGLSAGLGAVGLPKQLGLNGKHTNQTGKTRTMTIAWYVIGGIVAAVTINLLESRFSNNRSLAR